MSSFSFPTPTLFGPGVLEELPQRLRQLGIAKPLVVSDGQLVRTGAFSRFEAVLGAAGRGTAWHLYAGVHPNPVESDVRAGAEAYRAGGCDGVIGFGGGSALDVGKAVRLLIKRPGLDLAAYDYSEDWRGLPPFVAIPTTAGTGSEVGRSSVITLESTHAKKVIWQPELLARLVILDPELTRGLPARLTAATGADALTHCIESFTCPVFHPMCDGIALEGVRLIVEALPRACRDGNDMEARGLMLAAAAMGAVAFQKDLGAAHSLAHPLSSLCGLHHGEANAICLPAVMRLNAARKPGLYRRVGLACGLDVLGDAPTVADTATVDFLARFLADLGLNRRLSECGVQAGQFDELTAQAWADPCHRTNAVPLAREDLRGLYEAVF